MTHTGRDLVISARLRREGMLFDNIVPVDLGAGTYPDIASEWSLLVEAHDSHNTVMGRVGHVVFVKKDTWVWVAELNIAHEYYGEGVADLLVRIATEVGGIAPTGFIPAPYW
jgi:hypothetical protein